VRQEGEEKAHTNNSKGQQLQKSLEKFVVGKLELLEALR
jgi:hypothetical protein